MKNPWKKIQQRYVYEHHPHLKVRKDYVIRPDGKKGKYTVIERPDTVVIIPLLENGLYVLVRQWRYPINQDSLEFPMGAMEEGESSKIAAQREMSEETGYSSKNLKLLGAFYPANGLIKSRCSVYLAQNLTKTSQKSDPNEKIQLEKYEIPQIKDFIDQGKIDEAFTICGFYYLEKYLKSKS
ncbi:MAG: NUDIX domain-containing protein [Candidatus Moranbacteria bacterium]|nr:NUDIX domain-containing protein [Candidatus Moranbacteria bacterium]